MEFDSDYLSALDRKAAEIRYDPGSIGIAHGLGDPLRGIQAGVFAGAKNVELGFMGVGKGSKKSTPEAWGKGEREEIRQLAKINEVDITVHASPNIGQAGGSLSGFRQGSFANKEEAQGIALQEINRAIDFAADTAQGGPVVFHMEGFPRPIYSAGGEEGRFEAYPDEKKKAPIAFVNKITGELTQIRRDMPIPMPISVGDDYKKDKEGKYIIKPQTYEDIEKQYNNLSEIKKKELEKEHVKDAYSYLLHQFRRADVEEVDAKVVEYTERADMVDHNIKTLKMLRNQYKPLLKSGKGEEARAMFYHAVEETGLKPKEADIKGREMLRDDPFKYMEDREKTMIADRNYYRGAAVGLRRQSERVKEDLKNSMEVNKYAVDQEANTIARAGMNAYEIEKKRDLKEPLWVAPENWLIETYGSHPEEYKNLIQKSRKHMQNMLIKKKGMSKSEAKDVAEDHIKGTFDIGHFNMWKKFHQSSDEEYDSWLRREVRKLVKDNIIGHVHLSDNFGYNDEHVEIGEGNVPIQDFMKMLKKAKFKGKIIAEPGGQRGGEGHEHRIWTSALRAAGSPMYKIDTATQSWTDIEGSYFGRTRSPNFMVGQYAPSKDWTLWSEVPFE